MAKRKGSRAAKPTNDAEMADRIEEAFATLRRLPGGVMPRGFRGQSSLPPHVRQVAESYGVSPAQIPRIPPSGDAIDRMDEVFHWLAKLAKGDEVGARIVMARANGSRWRSIARLTGVSTSTVQRYHRAAIGLLVSAVSPKVKTPKPDAPKHPVGDDHAQGDANDSPSTPSQPLLSGEEGSINIEQHDA